MTFKVEQFAPNKLKHVNLSTPTRCNESHPPHIHPGGFMHGQEIALKGYTLSPSPTLHFPGTRKVFGLLTFFFFVLGKKASLIKIFSSGLLLLKHRLSVAVFTPVTRRL